MSTLESVPSRVYRRVLAACGCGHDGRLGVGEAAQPTTLLSTSAVTVLPFFLEAQASTGDKEDSVRSVHCGGYHTIVVMASGVLYGWGLHEDGQLGFGRAGKGSNKLFYAVPTRLTFFDELYSAELKVYPDLGPREDFILDVACGAAHSVVVTRCGLYVTGKNTHGQLGLGSDVDVFEWAPVQSLLGGRPLHHAEVRPSESDEHQLLAPVTASRQKNYVSLVRGRLTHVSCGTHHTMLGWKEALVERNADADATEQSSLEFHPVLILAAGKGDFGELGYGGERYAVLHAQEKRQYAALQNEARRTQMQGGVNTDNNGNPGTGESQARAFDGEWWKKMRAKERRPEFFSSHFLPVDVPMLKDRVVHVTHGAVSAADDTIRVEQPGGTTFSWELVSLRAMHLHSAATLLARSAPESSETVTRHVLHWGCYYCGEVEGLESSIPVEEEWNSCPFDYHAGNETLLRYRVGPPLDGALLAAKGTGVLGTGVDDADEPDWVDVSVAAPPPVTVRSISGRDHTVVVLEGEGGKREVWGFGANLHGQLARDGEDALLTPTPLVRAGDELCLPTGVTALPASLPEAYRVVEVHDAWAGVNHTICLVDVEVCEKP